jgi:hypothetical protein
MIYDYIYIYLHDMYIYIYIYLHDMYICIYMYVCIVDNKHQLYVFRL